MAAIATAPAGRRSRIGRRPRIGRTIVLAMAAVYFLGPLLAAFWFSIHGSTGISWHAYSHLVSAPGFLDALIVSAELALATVLVTIVLMVPTMLLVHLRFPRIRPLVEVLALFPLVVPPVVLVVGVSKVIAWGNNAPVDSITGQAFNQLLNSHPPLVLALEYVVLVLPFSFRAIDAGLRGSSITTLTEAARGLGASWLTILWRVVLPTLRTSVLNAAVLAFALVLGEFTMASILQYQTFPVWLLQFQNNDGQLSVALALMSLLLTWLVLIVFTIIAGRDPSARKVSS
ncbi:MAG: ABC transporter permease subunit [Actinomycetota bacterium]|nr:ABC transporter permease subunit [Actinomycetota bacterium]MDQ2956094.1 ABC transporter permease subunit [Actinomycetota bacterium]